ncbi:MAG: TM2 domain-containing protein [Clostridia bacterium]|nr:TM2 domain-containing protein [Clostridia bacterium]
MFCKNCGEAMNENQAICIKCGVKTGDGNKFCWNCGKEVAENAEVCLSCGVAVKKENGEYLAGKDKIVMILICFFLGGLGIHNFMMGETKKGVFKIILSFVCGIGGILALIDLIKIAMGSYVVDPDKLI